MFSAFENLAIRTKLVIAFLIVAAFSGLLGGVSIINIQKMEKADTFMYQEVAVPLAGLRDITQAFLLNRISTRALISATDPDEREEIADSLKENLASLESKTAAYVKSVDGKDEKAAFKEFKSAFDAYVPLLKQMVDLSLAGKSDEALAIAQGDASRQANNMLRALDQMATVSVKHAKSTAESNARLARTALIFSLVMSVAAVIVAVLMGLFVSSRLSTPLRNLRDSFQQVASGDLTVTFQTNCCDEVGSLAQSFASMVQQLRELILRVTETSKAVGIATRDLNSTSIEIANGAEVAAAQTISVATASEEMAATSHDIAHSCQVAVDGAHRANQTASSGAEIVRQTVEGMRRIATRGFRIPPAQLIHSEHVLTRSALLLPPLRILPTRPTCWL